MKHSLLSLASSKGVPLYHIMDNLHTSRRNIILAVYQLQEQGHHIYISHEKVFYIKKESKWPYIGFFAFGTALIYAMLWAVIQ